MTHIDTDYNRGIGAVLIGVKQAARTGARERFVGGEVIAEAISGPSDIFQYGSEFKGNTALLALLALNMRELKSRLMRACTVLRITVCMIEGWDAATPLWIAQVATCEA